MDSQFTPKDKMFQCLFRLKISDTIPMLISGSKVWVSREWFDNFKRLINT